MAENRKNRSPRNDPPTLPPSPSPARQSYEDQEGFGGQESYGGQADDGRKIEY